jgi:membrane-associated PAP2 superfamily phosphatase
MLKFHRKIDLAILGNILLIILAVILIDKTNIDLTIQNLLFDFDHTKWLVDKNEPVAKFFFYNLPKYLLGLTITSSLVILILNHKNKLPSSFKKYQRQIFILFLGIILIPLVAGNIKKFTNIYCPNQLAIYDGKYPYTKILEPYPVDFKPLKVGKCFPAGHAVTGFCFMILFFVFKAGKRNAGLLFGVALGWVLGAYQMFKGTHFFGDTLVGMLCCFLVALLIVRFVNLVWKDGVQPSLHKKG